MADPSPRRVWTSPPVLGWWIGTVVLSPFLALAKLRRYAKYRRRSEIDLARWQVPPLAPPPSENGPRLLLVGAGIGEVVLFDRLVEALKATRPDVVATYCLRDANTIRLIRESRPDQRLAVWPFEALPPIARLLRAERPDVVVFVERFRHTAFLTAAARSGARIALVNGRFRRRGIVGPIQRWKLRAFDAMAMQSEAHQKAVRPLVRRGCDVRAAGDLRLDLRRPHLAADRLASLKAWLSGERPLIVAGSTETPEEERMVLTAFRRVREQTPCRLLLAPRRPWEADASVEAVREAGLTVSRRTASEPPADVMLLDTLGELSTAYGEGHAAYVGGAFSEGGGGHNVLEPLLAGVPVAYGMRRGHFEALQKLCETHGVGTRIEGAETLAAFFARFLDDDAERKRVGEAGLRLIAENRGTVERTVEALIPLLGPETAIPN